MSRNLIRIPSVEGRSASPEAQRVAAQHLKAALARWRDPDSPLATGDDAADVAMAVVALATARAVEVTE